MQKVIPIVSALLAGIVVFAVISLLDAGKEAQRELVVRGRIEAEVNKVISQLRGNIDPNITNEQFSWYNAGRNSWVTSLEDQLRKAIEEERLQGYSLDVVIDGETISLTPK